LPSDVVSEMVPLEPMRRVALLFVLAGLTAAAGCGGSSEGSSSRQTANTGGGSGGTPSVNQESGPPQAQVRGCRERIEGRIIRPDPRRDSIVGPVAFLGARASYRATLAGARTSHLSAQPMKVIAVIRAGAPVTFAVPTPERQWLQLEYLQSIQPEDAVTLKPCAHPATAQAQRRVCHWSPHGACRSGLTQFNGGFLLKFRRAPRYGRCASLRVWVGERTSPIITRPFAGGGCRS
jgi:hypothetical protein